MFQHVGAAVYKRAVVAATEAGDRTDFSGYQLPSWAWIVFVLDLIILLPIILVVDYTLKQVYPTLAIIENENPPAYEPVSLDDDGASLADPEQSANPAGTKPTHGRAHTVTSSVRAINRVLKSNGGVRANFRGLACFAAQGLLTLGLMGIFSAALGGAFTPIATLLASLTLVQYSTAWVHIVISPRSELHFWRRLPPFKRTFEATWRAVTLYWLATEVTRWLPTVTAEILGLNVPKFNFNDGTEVEPIESGSIWKVIVVAGITILASIFIVIPAHVVLVRVQASLLPVDQDTIIPFDSSFEGKVEPAVVGGRGYATVKDAWSTFSRAAWRRLVILYVKVFGLSLAASFVMLIVLVPEFFLMAKHSTKVGDGSSDL